MKCFHLKPTTNSQLIQFSLLFCFVIINISIKQQMNCNLNSQANQYIKLISMRDSVFNTMFIILTTPIQQQQKRRKIIRRNKWLACILFGVLFFNFAIRAKWKMIATAYVRNSFIEMVTNNKFKKNILLILFFLLYLNEKHYLLWIVFFSSLCRILFYLPKYTTFCLHWIFIGSFYLQ